MGMSIVAEYLYHWDMMRAFSALLLDGSVPSDWGLVMMGDRVCVRVRKGRPLWFYGVGSLAVSDYDWWDHSGVMLKKIGVPRDDAWSVPPVVVPKGFIIPPT